jgi:hypothetical protein
MTFISKRHFALLFSLLFIACPRTAAAAEPVSQTITDSVCNSLSGYCATFRAMPSVKLANEILSINRFLIEQYVKDYAKTFKDDFSIDPKRQLRAPREMGQVFTTPFNATTPPPTGPFASEKDFVEFLSFLHLNSDLSLSLRDCKDQASNLVLKRIGKPIDYLNDESSDPTSESYRAAVELLNQKENIFKQLTTPLAKQKFIHYILARDKTNMFEYICDGQKDMPYCQSGIRDEAHPWVCRHYSRYMFHKYRPNPENYDNEMLDPFYRLQPVTEKHRLPIREIYVSFPDRPFAHAINAIYIGDKADPDTDSDLTHWHVFEPQTDATVSLRDDEPEGTTFHLLKNTNAPLMQKPEVEGFRFSGTEWRNDGTKIHTKTPQN